MRYVIPLTLGAAGALFLLKSMYDIHTWDKTTTAKIKSLHPRIRKKVERVVNQLDKKGYRVKVISGYRDPAHQQRLYNQGRTTAGPIVTNAKPGQSFHNYGLAFDISFGGKDFDTVVDHFKRSGFEWGGDFTSFPDRPHFQKSYGYNYNQLKKLPKIGKYPILV